MQAIDVATKPAYKIPTLDLQLESNWLITFLVSAGHILALFLIALSPIKHDAKKPPKKLLVHTVSLVEPKPIDIIKEAPKPAVKAAPKPPAPAPAPAPVVAEEPPAPKIAAPKPKPASKPVSKPKPAPKPVVKAKITPKPQPKKKEAAPKPKPQQDQKKQQQEAARKKEKERAEKEAKEQREEQAKKQAILDKALSSLDSSSSIEGKKASIAKNVAKSTSKAPSSISSLAAESLVAIEAEDTGDFTPAERTYYDELARRLKLALKLPEYGEIKLQLTIARSGSVVAVKNIKSKSKKNSDYLQKAIPKLHLPPFGQNFSGEKEHTFRLTLSSELSY